MSGECERCGSNSTGVALTSSMATSANSHTRAAFTPGQDPTGILRVALIGNPNTGKTTLFNRLCGLRHKTSNFPGTTQEARVGEVKLRGSDPASLLSSDASIHLIDLPGIYSLQLDQSEAEVCREVLAGNLSPRGERLGAPDAVCVVVDAANLLRNLPLVGEILAQRLPTVVAINMIDLARRHGVRIDTRAMQDHLGCRVTLVSARSGEGIDTLPAILASATIANRTPPGEREALEAWADDVHAACVAHGQAISADSSSAQSATITAAKPAASARASQFTDRLDAVLTHRLWGGIIFAAVMALLFLVIFKIAKYPMDWIDSIFGLLGGWVQGLMPPGVLRDLLSEGVVKGIGATVIFVPQICLLFFLISLLEDTGYLARAAFVMDRLLRPFGLPGHSFVPLLGSHACALPGIMATRAIPDRRDRLATILVAPFMTCSARIPVYVLVTTILFRDRPALAALAFVGCYVVGILAGLFSALIARRTILRGTSRPMVLELPTYKLPSVRTALLTTYDRGLMFIKNAGTNILAICVVLWWLGAFPRVGAPDASIELRQKVAQLSTDQLSIGDDQSRATDRDAMTAQMVEFTAQADRLEASHAKAQSFAGRLGRVIEPVFRPLGYDWQLCVGVVTSFAAREVFVSTMAVMVTGSDDAEDQTVVEQIQTAKRSDGVTNIFTPATSWSLLVFYVLAMQCLPTLVVTAKEAGGVRWAVLQLGWMSGLAYLAAWGTHALVLAINGS